MMESADIGDSLPPEGRRMHWLANWRPSEGESLPPPIRQDLVEQLQLAQIVNLALVNRLQYHSMDSFEVVCEEVNATRSMGIKLDADDGVIRVTITRGMGS